MAFLALHGLRRRSRGIALATVAVFALNWLGLALTPCAMAAVGGVGPTHAVAAEASAGTLAGVSAVFDAEALAAMSPDCRARMVSGAAPSDAAGSATPHAASPCPWCLEGGPTSAASHGTCGATSKPALDTRDMKGLQSPLLVALSATVLGFVPLDGLAPRAFAAGPELPPELPALVRYCRRLE